MFMLLSGILLLKYFIIVLSLLIDESNFTAKCLVDN